MMQIIIDSTDVAHRHQSHLEKKARIKSVTNVFLWNPRVKNHKLKRSITKKWWINIMVRKNSLEYSHSSTIQFNQNISDPPILQNATHQIKLIEQHPLEYKCNDVM